MIDLITELISKRSKRGFLANEIIFTCPKCGNKERSTYLQLLKNQKFEILEPTMVPNPMIRESTYEEEIRATPIKFRTYCSKCGSLAEAFSTVSLEYILNILQRPPPDDIMYG